MNHELILSEKCDGYGVITLNRPDVLNSFNEEMHAALAEAIARFDEDSDCRAVILTGAGRAFSAGQDLSVDDTSFLGDNPDLGLVLEKLYNPLIRRIRSSHTPFISAVNGVAAGAGANIALSCDIILAAKSARFIQAFAAIALIPDAGGTYWLTHRIGEVRAKMLAMTGDPVDAETAADWGLIWKAVDDETLMDEAASLAKRLASKSATGIGLTKMAIQAALTNSLDEQLDTERQLQREAGLSGDFKEGVRAFLEKRPAQFNRS